MPSRASSRRRAAGGGEEEPAGAPPRSPTTRRAAAKDGGEGKAAKAAKAAPPAAKAKAPPAARPRSPKKKAAAAAGGGAPAKKTLTAFVTVGTTRFDGLVAAADDPGFTAALLSRGFTHLAIQAGSGGGYAPHRLLGPGVSAGVVKVGKKQLAVEFFSYAPSLADRMASANLVISHAGAGSVFEALRAKTPLIAVPNPALMGDHQGELARSLEAAAHAFAASTSNLSAVVRGVDLSPGGRVPWVPGSPAGIVAALDRLAGRRV